MMSWRNIGRQWRSRGAADTYESMFSTSTGSNLSSGEKNYQKQREYENTRNQRVESSRSGYDNSVNPGYAVGTRPYTSPTPGREPQSRRA